MAFSFPSSFTIKPNLVEPSVRHFLDNILYQNYLYRSQWTNFIMNFFLMIVFLSAVIIFFIYKYKNRLTRSEIEQREKEKLQKTLMTIKNYKIEKMQEQQGIISGMPNWKNEYESIIQSQQFYR